MFDKILHPSDFTETSQIAFCHGLKIALAAQANLQMFHASAKGEHHNYHDFPSIRDVLERWRVIPVDSQRSAVVKLGIEAEKTIVHDDDPVNAISTFLRKHPSSLVVLASHSHWMGHSKAESISRVAAATSLFIPDGVPGFISIETGKLSLKNIVVPVAVEPSAARAIRMVRGLVDLLGVPLADVHIVHVGTQSTLPALPYDNADGVNFHVSLASGNVVSAIIEKCQEVRADLIAMTTDGHNGFLDAIRGNTTEQVLRKATCPLLAVTDK